MGVRPRCLPRRGPMPGPCSGMILSCPWRLRNKPAEHHQRFAEHLAFVTSRIGQGPWLSRVGEQTFQRGPGYAGPWASSSATSRAFSNICRSV